MKKKRFSFAQEYYLLSQTMNRFGKLASISKVLFFYTLSTVSAFQYPDNSSLRMGEIFSFPEYWIPISTLIYFLALFSRFLMRKSKVARTITRTILAAMFFFSDYVVLPIKLLTTIGNFSRLSVIMRSVVTIDCLIGLSIAIFACKYLRTFKPNSSDWFSLLVTPFELSLFLLTSFRMVVLALISEQVDNVVLQFIRITLPILIGAGLVMIYLVYRPFFNPTADITNGCLIIADSLINGMKPMASSLSGLIKLGVFIIPVAIVVMLSMLRTFGTGTSNHDTKSLARIKSLLVGERDMYAHVSRLGQKRVQLMIQNRNANVVTKNVQQAVGRAMTSVRPINLAGSPLLGKFRSIAEVSMDEELTGSITDAKFRSINGLTAGEKAGNRSTYNKAKVLGLNKDIQDRVTIEDQQQKANDLAIQVQIENCLGTRDPYRVFLKLMWVVQHKLTLGRVFELLNELKVLAVNSTTNSYWYYIARREVQNRLIKVEESEKLKIESNIKRAPISSRLAKPTRFTFNQEPKGKNEFGIRIERSETENLSKETVDLNEVFHMKSLVAQLVQSVIEFSEGNIKYLENLTLSESDLYSRVQACRDLFAKDEHIRKLFREIEQVAGKQDFQHLTAQYYHEFYNVSRHTVASRLRQSIKSRFIEMKRKFETREPKVTSENLTNECVVLMIESQRKGFGDIIDAYGRTDMMLDSSASIIGANYTIFMNETLKSLHQSLEAAIYSCQLDAPNTNTFGVSRYGFVKVPHRNIMIPSMVYTKICCLQESGFKFMVAIKPDFNDTKLYIALKENMAIDGYSSSFLSVCKEEFLSNNVPLYTVGRQIHQSLVAARGWQPLPESGEFSKSRVSDGMKSPLKAGAAFFEDQNVGTRQLNVAALFGSMRNNTNKGLVCEDKLKLFSVKNSENYIERQVKCLVKHHKYSNKLLKSDSNGYWYLCLSVVDPHNINMSSRAKTIESPMRSRGCDSEDASSITGLANWQLIPSKTSSVNYITPQPAYDRKPSKFQLHSESTKKLEPLDAFSDDDKIDSIKVRQAASYRHLEQVKVEEDIQEAESEAIGSNKQIIFEPTKLPKKKTSTILRKNKAQEMKKRSVVQKAYQIVERRSEISRVMLDGPVVQSKTISIANQLLKPTDEFYFEIERAIKQKRKFSLYRYAQMVFLFGCVAVFGSNLGLNAYLYSNSHSYATFLDLHLALASNIVDLKELAGYLIRTEGLKQGLVNNTRYSKIAAIEPAGLMKGYPTYSAWLFYRRVTYMRSAGLKLKDMTLASLATTTTKFMTQQPFYKINLKYAENKTVNKLWNLQTAQTFVTQMMIKLAQGLPNATVISFRNPYEELTLMDYLTNQFLSNSELMINMLRDQQTATYYEKLKKANIAFYSIVIGCLVLIILNVVILALLVSKIKQVYQSFCSLKRNDIIERSEQLRVVIKAMQRSKQHEYYLCEGLSEGYWIPEMSEQAANSGSKLSFKERTSKPMFMGLYFSILAMTSLYAMMAGSQFTEQILANSRVDQLKWLEEKQEIAEAITFKYIDHYNQMTQYLILKSTYTYNEQSMQVFLQDYEAKILKNIRHASSLAEISTPSSQAFDAEILSTIQQIYQSDICGEIGGSLLKTCQTIDSQYSAKGISQIESHFKQLLIEVYTKYVIKGVNASQIMNAANFVEFEFAFNEFYIPMFIKVYHMIVKKKNDFVGSTMLKSIIYFSVATVLIVLLAMSLASIPFYKFNKATQIVNFSFTLLSLHSYVTNFHLKKSISTTLRIKQTFLAES